MTALLARLRELPALKAILTLGLLIAAMAAMLTLKTSVSEVGSPALTFAAVGFVVLAAYALAELVSMIGLPRVTGYILAGIGLGPSAASMMGLTPPLLSTQAVTDMEVFNQLALALIALEAGLELSLGAMRRFKRTLASIILFKVPLAWLMVGGAFIALASTIAPVAGLESTGAIIAVGLVLGAISVGTSPAVSVAVISEAQAKGKTADLVLGFAVFKDVVMVIMLGLAIALGKPLAEDSAFSAAIVFDLLKTIGVSVLVGVALGGGLIAWMRWVRWETILLLLVVAYGVMPLNDLLEGALHLHFKPLLVFITAGFTVANFSRYGHDLHKPLALLALPVFVIFFTTAGATLDIASTLTVLPLAAALFCVRGGMMYLATRLGGRLAKEPVRFTNALWLGFISQAGVALVLLGTAMKEMEALAEPMQRIGFALIALNLLIGPVLLRYALKRGKEIEAEAQEDAAAAGGPAGDAAASATAPVAPNNPALRTHYDAVSAHVSAATERVVTNVVHAWRDEALARLSGEVDDAQALAPISVSALAENLRREARALRDTLIELPVQLAIPDADAKLRRNAGPSGLAAGLRRARYQALNMLRGGVRRVGVRSLARAHVEGAIVVALADLLTHLGRAEAARLDALDAAARDGRRDGEIHPPDLAATRAAVHVAADRLAADLRSRTMAGVAGYATGLSSAGTPAYADRALSFAMVAKAVDRAIAQLDLAGPRWDDALSRIAARVQLRDTLLEAEAGVIAASHAALARWEPEQRDVLINVTVTVREAIAGTLDTIAACNAQDPAEVVQAQIAEVIALLDGAVNEAVLPRIRDMRLQAEEQGALKVLEREVAALVPQTEDKVTLAPPGMDVERVVRPESIRSEDKPVAATIDKYLAGELTWALAETRAEDEELSGRVGQRLSEVVGSATVGLTAGIAEIIERERDDPALSVRVLDYARTTLSRARRVVDDLLEVCEHELAQVPTNILASADDAFLRVYQRLVGEPGDGGAQPVSRAARAAKVFARLAGRVGAGWRWGVAHARQVYQRVAASELAQRARLRSGRVTRDPSQMAADLRQLEPSEAQLDRMPYVLARLFTPGTLDTHHLLSGVEREVTALRDAYARFEAGTPTAVLVRGDAGSGKTSMARVTLRGLLGRRLVDVVIAPEHRSEAVLCETLGATCEEFSARSFKTLERALQSPRRVILLDGLEQLFVRTEPSLTIIRKLLRLMLQTRGHVMWVVSIDEPTARLLEPLTDLSGYFTDHLRLEPLSAEALGTLIDARCKLSGFEVRWPDAQSRARRRVNRLLRRTHQERQGLRHHFLRALAERSGGNIRDALTLFINAIEVVGSETITLRPLRLTNLGWFGQLGRDAHRLLASTVLSGALSEAEARAALRFAPDRLASARGRLLGAGLLVSTGDDRDRLRVRPHAWRRVVALLRERNELT